MKIRRTMFFRLWFCALFYFPLMSFSQTNADSNKELSELVSKSGMSFIGAFVISAEMQRDTLCSGYKDIPKFSAEEWANSLEAPRALREQLKTSFIEALEKQSNQFTKDGKRQTEVSIYLPVKELHVKSLAGVGANNQTTICERLTGAARRHFASSISMMNSALALEKSAKSKK